MYFNPAVDSMPWRSHMATLVSAAILLLSGVQGVKGQAAVPLRELGAMCGIYGLGLGLAMCGIYMSLLVGSYPTNWMSDIA